MSSGVIAIAEANVKANAGADANEYYDRGAAAYADYLEAKKSGKSDAEAAGRVGGAIAGTAACAATGVGASVTPLCGALGGIVGGFIGGLFGGGAPESTHQICTAIWDTLNKMEDATRARGVPLPDHQLVWIWFLDGTYRAAVASLNIQTPGWLVIGSVGSPGSYIQGPNGRRYSIASGRIVWGEEYDIRLPVAFPWAIKRGVCLPANVHFTGGVPRSAIVGLATVGARLDAWGQSHLVLGRLALAPSESGSSTRAAGVAGVVLTLATVGGLGWALWSAFRQSRRS